MKKIIVCVGIALSASYLTITPASAIKTWVGIEQVQGTIEIKIKNDTDDEVRVVTGRGSHYSLTKGATTTIKLEDGDWLYTEKGGLKDQKLIQATSDNEGQTFMLSKLL
jgi:hypothetical protein